MEMKEAIQSFHTQFSFVPEIVNSDELAEASQFVLGGMGGSGHAADLLRSGRPDISLIAHRNYGLPQERSHDGAALHIASSYSGNTEETLDFLKSAHDAGLPLAGYASGGKLIEQAETLGLAHIVLPDVGLEPRSALGYSIVALATLMGRDDVCRELRELEGALNPDALEAEGKELALKLLNHVPVIYTSTRNRAVANNWKIKFNETGKIPAYYDVFPELNHNEIEGYSNANKGRTPTGQFYFLFLTDGEDHPRIRRRMEITKGLYEKRGLPTRDVPLIGQSRFERMFNSLLLADWTALYTARQYRLDPSEVSMVEDLKTRLE